MNVYNFRCDPPFFPANPERSEPLLGRKVYLVCGRTVRKPGAYEDWSTADLQYKSASAATIKSYYDWSELKAAWHVRCDAGEHDHPAAPVPSSSSTPTSPQRAVHAQTQRASPAAAPAIAPATRRMPTTPASRTAPTASSSVARSSSSGPRHTHPTVSLPPPPPTYTTSAAPSAQGLASVEPVGLMCYAVRVGREGESFTDPAEARTRFLALQAAGKNPGFVAAPSVARCMRWIEETPSETVSPWTTWIAREDRARREQVAEQRVREIHHRAVLDALVIRRGDNVGYDSDGSDLSRSTADLEGELGARESFGNQWGEM
ncbi:hypothetical protein B0H13DRAFT_1915414 [Mycena leptocephala]|nr:hypothetical protein B0H13DRAFT_1915414 [Mycena leptocephala]